MINLQWKSLFHLAAILTSSLLAASAAWSQNASSQVQVSAAPVQKTESASKDDRSYLPPSMRGDSVPTNAAVPVSAQADQPVSRVKSARQHRKRDRRYAQGYDGFFND
jgi:hypothetical protein